MMRRVDSCSAIRFFAAVLTLWIYGSSHAAGQTAAEFHKRGTESLRQKQYDLAIVEFSEAIRLDPKLAAAYAGRARARGEKQELDKAFADANDAVRIDPTLADAYVIRGLLCRKEPIR